MSRSFIRASCIAVGALLWGCGGGGGDDSWLYPLWVPTDVVVSDVDDDGRADVLTLAMLALSQSRREGRLVVHRQTGPGHFAAPESHIVGTYPWDLDIADLDGDRLADAVVTDVDERSVWLLMQDARAPGRFLPAQTIATDIRSYAAAIADLNGDALPDIAVTDQSTTSRRILLRYHDPGKPGTFLPPVDFPLPGTAADITAGDLDGDSLADLLMWIRFPGTGGAPEGSLAFSLQQPGGELGPLATLAPQTGLNVGVLTIDDYDRDGRSDLFVFFKPYSSSYRAKLTVVLQESPGGTFAAPVDTSLAGVWGIDDAVVADLDGDDGPDAAVVGFYPVGSPSEVRSRVNLFEQAGAGAFALATVYGMPIPVSRVAAGDIDGDGLNDLVTLGEGNLCLVQYQSRAAPGTFGEPQALR